MQFFLFASVQVLHNLIESDEELDKDVYSEPFSNARQTNGAVAMRNRFEEVDNDFNDYFEGKL